MQNRRKEERKGREGGRKDGRKERRRESDMSKEHNKIKMKNNIRKKSIQNSGMRRNSNLRDMLKGRHEKKKHI